MVRSRTVRVDGRRVRLRVRIISRKNSVVSLHFVSPPRQSASPPASSGTTCARPKPDLPTNPLPTRRRRSSPKNQSRRGADHCQPPATPPDYIQTHPRGRQIREGLLAGRRGPDDQDLWTARFEDANMVGTDRRLSMSRIVKVGDVDLHQEKPSWFPLFFFLSPDAAICGHPNAA